MNLSLKTGITVALLLISCALSPAHADGTTTALAIYSQNNSAAPYMRTWIASPEGWSAQSTISPAPASGTPWVTPLNSPVANESAIVIFDASRNLSLQIASGSSWGSAVTLATNVGTASGGRACAAAYDPSGKLIIAYWKGASGQLAIRVRSAGGTLGGESLYDIGTGLSGLRWVTLTRKPQSNRMLILALDGSGKLIAGMWNGSSSASGWTTLASDVDSLTTESFAGAWEQSSRTPMVVYRRSGQTAPCYRRYVSDAWTTESTITTTSPATFRPVYTRLAPKPASNQILLCACDASANLGSALWNGSAWTALSTAASLHNQSSGRRTFDVAWQADGAQALMIYGGQNGNAKFRRRTFSGSSWSSESVVGSNTATAQVTLLYPQVGTSEIWAMAMDAGNKVYFAKWSGSAITTWSQLTSGSSYPDCDSFGLIMPTTLAPADDEPLVITDWEEVEPD